jgi:HD-GYP domain-containing protein (c-di-GMP phosphodiesterase class II)
MSKRQGQVPFKAFKIPISHKSIAGYVQSTGEILNIPCLDIVGDDVPYSLKTMREFDAKMNYHSVSMLAVPMRNHKDDIIGVIQLINALDRNGNPIPFEKSIEDLVISLSSQAAVAICNSLLIRDIKNLFESIVTYSAEAIDARSPHTAGHSDRVSKLAILLAHCINRQTAGPFAVVRFSEEALNELRIAALLHDIGKIGVRERVLDKINKLTDDRVEAIKNRFAYIRRDIEFNAELLRRTSGDEAAEKALAGIADLDADLELILRLNVPKFYSDEDGARLDALAARTYRGVDGSDCPLITPEEYICLKVRKGNLTGDERTEIESHVHHTLKILNRIPFTDELKNIPSIAASHHEMLNGTGYPNGLTAESIPLEARMLAIADIYDALTAKDRPYKPPLPLPVTLKIIREEADNNRLDKDLVDLFIAEEVYKDM